MRNSNWEGRTNCGQEPIDDRGARTMDATTNDGTDEGQCRFKCNVRKSIDIESCPGVKWQEGGLQARFCAGRSRVKGHIEAAMRSRTAYGGGVIEAVDHITRRCCHAHDYGTV